jgi:hypothetical protein
MGERVSVRLIELWERFLPYLLGSEKKPTTQWEEAKNTVGRRQERMQRPMVGAESGLRVRRHTLRSEFSSRITVPQSGSGSPVVRQKL